MRYSIEDLIEEAKNRGVKPYDLFQPSDALVNAESFFKCIVSKADSYYQQSPEMRILRNNKNNPFYQVLLDYLDSEGTGNKRYPRLEPAIIRKTKTGNSYLPVDGRHRAKFCMMLGIKLPANIERK